MNELNSAIPLQANVAPPNLLAAYMQGVQLRGQMMANQQQQMHLNALQAYAQAMKNNTTPDGIYNGQAALGSLNQSGSAMPDVANQLMAGTGQNTSNLGAQLGLNSARAANTAMLQSSTDPASAAQLLALSGYGATGGNDLNSGINAQSGALGLQSQNNANTAAGQAPGDANAQAIIAAQAGTGATSAPAIGQETQAAQGAQNLNVDKLNQLRNIVGPLAMSPNITPEQVDAALDLASIHGVVPPQEVEAIKNEVASIGPNQAAMHSFLTQVYAGGGPGNLGQVLPHSTLLNTGTAVVNAVTNPLSGQTQNSGTVAATTTPTPIVNANGTASYVTPGAALGQTASNPQAVTAATGAGQVSSNVISAANTSLATAPARMTALNNAYQAIAQLPTTGKWGSVTPNLENALSSIPGFAAALNIKPGTAINYEMASKYLAQYQQQTMVTMGIGGTDFQLSQHAMAFPHLANTQAALLEMTRYQMGMTAFDQARAKYVLNQSQNNPAGATQAAATFTNNVGLTPFLVQKMSSGQYQSYVKSLTPQQRTVLSKQAAAYQQMIGGGQ